MMYCKAEKTHCCHPSVSCSEKTLVFASIIWPFSPVELLKEAGKEAKKQGKEARRKKGRRRKSSEKEGSIQEGRRNAQDQRDTPVARREC